MILERLIHLEVETRPDNHKSKSKTKGDAKDRALKEKADAMQEKAGAMPEGEEPTETASLFSSDKQEFENLTPLMLRPIKAHKCLCPDCSPEYAEDTQDQARKEARTIYERSVATEARVELYEAAVSKYKEDANALALDNIREEVKSGVRKEVIADYEKGLRADLERQWTEEKRIAMKKEVQESLLARMRDGM